MGLCICIACAPNSSSFMNSNLASFAAFAPLLPLTIACACGCMSALLHRTRITSALKLRRSLIWSVWRMFVPRAGLAACLHFPMPTVCSAASEHGRGVPAWIQIPCQSSAWTIHEHRLQCCQPSILLDLSRSTTVWCMPENLPTSSSISPPSVSIDRVMRSSHPRGVYVAAMHACMHGTRCLKSWICLSKASLATLEILQKEQLVFRLSL